MDVNYYHTHIRNILRRVVRVAKPTTKKRLLAMQEAMATSGCGEEEEVWGDADEPSTSRLEDQAPTSHQESTGTNSTISPANE